MGDKPASLENFSRTPVPDEATVSGVRIALVLIAVAIALPAFITGMKLGQSLGFTRAAIAMFGGGCLLAAIGSATALVGARVRLSTYMIILFAFGRRAGMFVNLCLSLSLFGWFGVLAVMFGDAAQNLVADHDRNSLGATGWMLLGSGLMVATTMFGFRALDRLSILVTPAKAILLIVTLLVAIDGHGLAGLTAPPVGSMSIGTGITIVAGGLMVGATLMPDLCRYARTGRDGVSAAILGYGVGFPLVLLASAIPPLVTGQDDLIAIMVALGLGVPALLVVVLATWTTNSFNLYSATLVLATSFKRLPYWVLALAAGIAGTTFALAGIANYLIPYLLVLGVFVPPVAAVYVLDYFLHKERYSLDRFEQVPTVRRDALAAWLTGAALGLVTSYGNVTLTGAPALDSLAGSALVFLLITRLSLGVEGQ